MASAGYICDVLFDNMLNTDSYLCDLPVIQYLSRQKHLPFSSPVTFFVGENGTGKSTLLEAIAVAYGFNAEGGTRNFSFSTTTTHSELYEHITLAKRAYAKDGFFLRAESVYTMASYIDEIRAVSHYGGISLHNQSHGESLLAVVQNRFSGNGLYILDEPEAALSPMHLLTLMTEIHTLVEDHSQFIIATHSPILMAFPNADILEFSQEGIKNVQYKDTAHYQITKRFLDNPERMLEYLFSEK